MSLTIDELRALAAQAVSWTDSPTGVNEEEVIPHLESEDRNVRVAALRVLAFCDGTAAVDGILRAFDDPKKRVRDVAVKGAVRFVHDPRIVERLQRAVQNEESTAGPAMQILAGMYNSPYGLTATEPIASALAALLDHEKYRRTVLVSVLRAAELTPPIKELLHRFVADGSKDDAVAATRRLCGFRLMHRQEMTDAARVSADRAFSDLWFWVHAD